MSTTANRMNANLDQLVCDVTELTGAPKPTWFEDGAPVLNDTTAGTNNDDEGFYLIGIIGGKDVGKSALVNAIVGNAITAQTSHGPGTETVIAYAHESQAASLKKLLDLEVPGQYSITTHRNSGLVRQVLLDLPDIDSHYMGHLEVTRRMLRHMLFPIWVQSVEKYADRQPQQMLTRVAAGNSPANFVFCLNKVDQVDGRSAENAIAELQDDFAIRLAKTLALPSSPRVWAISAIRPDRYELPSLREVLAQQKSTETVRESRQLAAVRQQNSVLAWLADQELPAKAARLGRLQDEAEEYVTDRIGGPLMDGVIPRLLDDPAHRQAVIDDCLHKRVARWPIVNVLHSLYSTIGAIFRRNTEARPRPLGAQAGELLVDQHLMTLAHRLLTSTAGTSASGPTGQSLASIIQTTFALLQQSHPALGPLYRQRKLWESMPASVAAGALREAMIATIERQREMVSARAAGKDTPAAALFRGIFTIGAVFWFTVGYPLARLLVESLSKASPATAYPPRGIGLVLIDLLSPDNLLRTITLLIIYFTGIWLFLRWDTQRRVSRQFAKWKRLDSLDPALSLAGCCMEWINGLLDPIRNARERFDSLVKQTDALRESVKESAAA